MTDTQHTPGPWRTHHTGSTRVIANVPDEENDIHTICNTWSSPLSPPRLEASANACLIAAAPDLLAAARLVIAHLRCEYADPVQVAARDALIKAIAKAEG